jgi:uncharacterized protein
MTNLISETCRKVESWLDQCANPCVLWSGGKDSTAMLHLIRHEVGAKLPCVQWREPRFRSRYAHSDRLAAEWDLEVYDWTPLAYALTDGYDIETGQPRFDFVKCYEMAPRKVMFLCLGTEEPKAEELASGRYLCGLDALRRPTGTFSLPLGRRLPRPEECRRGSYQGPSAARRGRLGAGRCADPVLPNAPLERCGRVGLPGSGRRAQRRHPLREGRRDVAAQKGQGEQQRLLPSLLELCEPSPRRHGLLPEELMRDKQHISSGALCGPDERGAGVPPDVGIYDCQRCGACCSHKWSWPVLRRDRSDAVGIPQWMLRDDYPLMKTTNSRCVALTGKVGCEVGCSIYNNRPNACRAFVPGSQLCREAREAAGII